MKFLILIIAILSFLPQKKSYKWQKKQYINISIAKEKYNYPNLYKAIITGNKKGVLKKHLKLLKRYGTIHLLTPSGIHLSSVIILFKNFALLSSFLLLFLLIFLSYFESYLSMERILIFKLLSKFQGHLTMFKNPEITFVITIFTSFIIGHYQKNPLSLIYSMSFWGTIILFRNNPAKCLLGMNFILFLLGSISHQSHSILSIIFNPLITLFISSFFPLLFFNSLLPDVLSLNFLINIILEVFISFHELLMKVDPFPLIRASTSLLIVFYLFLLLKKRKLGFLILVLFYQSPQKQVKTPYEKVYYRYNKEEIFKSSKRGWFRSKSNRCKFTNHQFYCKKKGPKKGP